MATDFQTAWDAYREALDSLYAGADTGLAERGGAERGLAPEILAERADALIERSAAVGAAAASGLGADDADERELSELRLLAAAAIDIGIANELAGIADGAEGPGGAVVERGGRLPGLEDAMLILDTTDMQSLLAADLAVERAARPSDPAAARTALRETVQGALDDLRDDAARTGRAAFVGLVELPFPAIHSAATAVVQEILRQVGQDVGRLLQKAVGLVARAIEKLLALLGKENAERGRQKALDWVEELQRGTAFEALAEKLYEPARIRQEVDGLIDAAPGAEAGPFNTAAEQIDTLVARFGKQRKTIETLLRGLSFARGWLMTLVPWGPLAVTTAYLSALSYAVLAGGDYVDWYRTIEALNLVPGLRTVVRESLTAT